MIEEYKLLIDRQEKVVKKLHKMVDIGTYQLKNEKEFLETLKQRLKDLEENK